MKRKSRILALVVATLLLTVVFGPSAAAAGQIRFAITQDEGTLNPYTYVTGYPGHNLLLLVFDALMQIDAEGVPQPWLAKTVVPSEGGKVWKITLDEKAKWHDGKPLTSADVKFTFEYVVTKEGTHSRWSSPSKAVASIDTPDAQTVILTLKTANPSFAIRPLADMPILPKHVWEGVKEPKKFENSVGSGPYKVAQIDKDKFVKLEANPDYYKGKPNVDTLVLEIIKDANAMFTALKAGQVDATARALQPELVSQFEADKAVKTTKGPSFTSTILLFNTEKAPYSKKEFRQAVDFAVNKTKLVETVLLGQGVAATGGFVHPDLAWAEKNLKVNFDQAKAKQLLDGLGMKDADNDGFRENADGSKLEIALLAYSNNPLRIRAAELIAADLKVVGVKATVKAMEPTTLDDLVWKEFDVSKGRNFDMAMFGWSAPIQSDPRRLLDLVHSDVLKGTINLGAYKNPQADQIGDQLAVELDQAKRYDLNKQLQKLMSEEVPLLPLWFPQDTYAYNPKTYDGWVYTKGQGILSKISFFSAPKKEEAPAAKPAEPGKPVESAKTQPQESTANKGNGLIYFTGIAALAVAAMVYFRRRGRAK